MMISFISWFLLPLFTLAVAAGGWPFSAAWPLFSGNFSVTAADPSGRFLLITWAAFAGIFFRFLIRRIIGQAAPFLSAKRELFLTDCAVLLLCTAVLLPYCPQENYLSAALHVAFAFWASVLYFLVLLSIDLKLYFWNPTLFSGTTAALFYSIFAAAALFYLSDFLISTALEIFVVVFSDLLLLTLFKKVCTIQSPS
ncbi:MAG: hypothetical protein HFE84_04670 [Lachnospiraceae bacterium]|nr:hypothetical protein [Lachnospiraceae bacterium]